MFAGTNRLFIWWLPPFMMVAASVAIPHMSHAVGAEATPATPIDFRTRLAPPEVRLAAAPKLMRLLELSDEQQTPWDARLVAWEEFYRKRQAEVDSFSIDDPNQRRGWPPTRDRELRMDLLKILTPEQRETFENLTVLWGYSPVRSDQALHRRYEEELKLNNKQREQLFALDVEWILFARAELRDVVREKMFPDSLRYWREAALAGWKFKPTRDRAWGEILTEEQAQRWQQLEFQEQLLGGGLGLLQSHLLNDYEARASGDLPQRGTGDAYFVPYFPSPAKMLAFTDEQMEKLAVIFNDYEQAARAQPREVTKDNWQELRAAAIAGFRQAVQRMEQVMTEKQRARWRSMIGEPIGIMKEHFP